MSASKVRSAIAQAFVSGAFFANTAVSYENMTFTPPSSGPWAAFNFVPAGSGVFTLGPTGRDELTGFVQIDVNYPVGTGGKDAGDKADAIRNTFTAGKTLSYSGQVVTIKQCTRSHGRLVNNYYKVSVTIYFYAFLNR